jgi:hypothetical protein
MLHSINILKLLVLTLLMPEFLLSFRPHVPDVGLQGVHQIAQGVNLDRELILKNARRRACSAMARSLWLGRGSSSTSDATLTKFLCARCEDDRKLNCAASCA